MTKAKMTIHRGLSELKTLDDRIEKSMNDIKPNGIMQKGKLVDGIYDKAEFVKDAKARLQATNDLILRKTAIKTAIVESNSKTTVTVGEKSMTVADAITEKDNVIFRKKLIDSLERKYKTALGQFNVKNEENNQKADQVAGFTLNQDGKTPERLSSTEAVALRKSYVEANEYELVDPLEVEKYIQKEREAIAIFEMEVDAVLSESNAVTMIEV